MRYRIGLVYVPGSLPCFEDFGCLPTDTVNQTGLVDGKPASEVLDLLIIPGGSLVESGSITENILKQTQKMAEKGKFVLGVCSGFQVLANTTDIGRLSATPILRKGLGLLDVSFEPMVCTDRVTADIVGKSFITDTVSIEVTGFHCHTYGKIVPFDGGDVRPILVSHIRRVNYRNAPQIINSGFANKEGNVVGVLTHALLDENLTILQSVVNSLDISVDELQEIRATNSRLRQKIKQEVGVLSGVFSKNPPLQRQKPLMLLFTTATGSGSGKTFIVTGIAGALKKRGVNVGLLKVGGDIRDIVPALYLIKEPIRTYSSIRVANSGWMSATESVKSASQHYDFLLVEGAMGPFTGFLNEDVERPASTVEVAAALCASTILVVACDKTGIEGAVVNGLTYVIILKALGIKVVGVILNKVHTSYLTPEIRERIRSAFNSVGVTLLGVLPRIALDGRGAIPEIEIKYEEFGAKAIETVEQSLDLDTLLKLAQPIATLSSCGNLLDKFKLLLDNGCVLDTTKGASQ